MARRGRWVVEQTFVNSNRRTALSVLGAVGAGIGDELAAVTKLEPTSNVSADVAMAVAIE